MVSSRGQLAALAAVVALVPSSVLGVPIYGQCGGIGWTVSRIHTSLLHSAPIVNVLI